MHLGLVRNLRLGYPEWQLSMITTKVCHFFPRSHPAFGCHFYRCLAAQSAAKYVCILIYLSVCLFVGFCILLCPLLCIWSPYQSCMVVCLQCLDTKGILHLLPTLQNNEPVPQVSKQVVNLSCLICNT